MASAPVTTPAGLLPQGNWMKNSTGYQILLVVLLSLNFGIVFFDRQALNVLMPQVQPELGLSQTQIGIIAGGLSFTWAIAAFFYGRLSDSLGKRKILLVMATLAFSLCSFLTGLASSFALLLGARLLMGAAEGGVMPISHAMVASEVDPKFRGLAQGVAQNLGSNLLGSFAAPVVLVAFALAFGLSLGILAALRQNSLIDYGSVAFATFGASVPNFVIGIILVVVLAVRLRWLPTGGWGSAEQAVMPVLALGALPAAYLARVTRASILEALRQEYVRTAWAKGLPEQVIILRHVLRNALIPVLTLAGPIAVNLVTGSFIVETIFSIPGIGRLFVQGVFQRDYGLIMGTVLFYAFLVALANLMVDLLYAVVDPRIRYS